MYLLLSGEGKSDLGKCSNMQQFCEADDFNAGPMAIIIDQLIQEKFEMSHIDCHRVVYITETALAVGAKSLRPQKKSLSLPGKKKQQETMYFFKNARILAKMAKEKMVELNDTVIAVLFRDCDGTHSSPRTLWQNKWNSIIRGFYREEYTLGVPMLPKPKSEAWLLCGVKNNPYQNCERLENESGNDNSDNSLKDQLSEALDGDTSTDSLVEKLKRREIDISKIDMPSFNSFKDHLHKVLNQV